MPVYDDDPDAQLPAGMPYGTGASSLVIENAAYRIIVDDDLDIDGNWGYTSAPLCAGAAAGTLTAVYNDTVARVELTGSGIDPFTLVLVEKSTDQIHWSTVRGGVTVTINAGGFTLNDYEFTNGVPNYYRFTTLAPIGCQTSGVVSVTPALTRIWIKSVNRPFLNLSMPGKCTAMGASDLEMLTTQSDITRPARSGVFPVVNRTYAVAVNDIRTGRQWTMQLRTFTKTSLKNVDFLFTSGDVLLVQVPSGCAESIENGYVSAGDVSYLRHHRWVDRVVWTISVVEVAPPGPDIVYAESTWQTVINQYGSWAAVVAAFPSWQALLAIVPNPNEVIVP